MNTNHFKIILSICIFACFSFSAASFNASRYATKSKLATGKWVKVKVEESGIYEITFDELAEMGFTDPNKVRIYGSGGFVMSEFLNGTHPDDLVSVPYNVSDNKIYFYGKGPVKMYINKAYNARFARTINTYSTAGYYFITEQSQNANKIKHASEASVWGSNVRDKSVNYVYHEAEEYSYSCSGKDLYGEDVKAGLTLDMPMPNISDTTTVLITCAFAATASAESTLNLTLNGEAFPLDTLTATVTANSGYETYKIITPYTELKPTTADPNGKISISFTDEANLKSAHLDYLIATYTQDNAIGFDDQIRITYTDLGIYDRVSIYNDSKTLQVWDVTNPDVPKKIYTYNDSLEVFDEELQETIKCPVSEFTPGIKGTANYIAFDPTRTLMKIKEYEVIENQNIHGESTPDYVIITTPQLRAQAERLAQLHRDNSNLDVLVIDHNTIFNEFSSGTPDATAYRLMLKMFYDRNPEKLKYVLLFGGGYFDNRQLQRNKGENYLLTFQSAISNNSISTYVSDDYFAMLADNSGNNILTDAISIGVGRLPVVTEKEATDVVDKIEDYMNNTDFSNWRNKVLIMDEYGDENIHMFQGANLETLFHETDGINLDIKKYHVAAYTLVESAASPVFAMGANNAKTSTLQLADFLKQGVLFATYMGHGGATSLSKRLVWTRNDVLSTPLPRLPIMTLAACDIANFDSNTRGIGEYMVITPGHGAIGIFTTTRTVEATENDFINRAFIQALFTKNSDGTFRRLGDAYKTAKHAYGNTSSRNKMCFSLLADPALQPAFPTPLVKLDSVNGSAASESSIIIKPMTKVTITGHITTEDGEIDTEYNGDATLSLYDAQQLYTKFTYESVETEVYHNRPLLTESSVKVTNGKFTADILVPKNCQAGKTGLLKFFAHSNNNSTMVNGTLSNLTFAEYNEADSETIIDTEAPVVNKMYINNEESFANNIYVNSNITLHISVSDNVSLSNPSQQIGKQMTLKLEDGTLFDQVKGFATISNNGENLDIALPLNNINEGQHSLTFFVCDAAGNSTSHSINFIVISAEGKASLSVNEHPAREMATFNLSHNFNAEPTVKITVMNAKKEIVWQQSVDSFPYEWNLNDNAGNRLPAGVYTFFGTATTDAQSGGTEINRLAIIDK